MSIVPGVCVVCCWVDVVVCLSYACHICVLCDIVHCVCAIITVYVFVVCVVMGCVCMLCMLLL